VGRFVARFARRGVIAGAARDTRHLGARFPRLKPWVYGYVSLFEPVLCEGLYLFCFDDMLIASKIDFNF